MAQAAATTLADDLAADLAAIRRRPLAAPPPPVAPADDLAADLAAIRGQALPAIPEPKPHSYEEMRAAEARLRGGETPAMQRPAPLHVEAGPSATVPESVRVTGGVTAPEQPSLLQRAAARVLKAVSKPAFPSAGNVPAGPPGPAESGGMTVPGSVRVTEPPTDVNLPAPVRQPQQLLDPKTARVSDPGLETIKQDREGGFYATPYRDTNGWAIGYGMRTWKGKPVRPGMKITQEEADSEMRRRADDEYGAAVRNALTVPVTQNQYDALVSVAWNSPDAAVNLAKRLNRGETLTEADFKASGTVKNPATNKSEIHPGLQARRGEEFAQFAGQRGAPPVAQAAPVAQPPAPIAPPVAVPAQPEAVTATAPTPAGASQVYARGRFTGLPGAPTQTRDFLTEGVIQAAQGAQALAEQAKAVTLPTIPNVMRLRQEGRLKEIKDDALNGASDVLEGSAKAGAAPAAVVGAIFALPETLLTFALSYLAGKGTEQAAIYAGASPAMQRFLSNVATTATAVGGASRILGAAKEAGIAAAETAGKAAGPTVRSAVLTAQLAGRQVGATRPVPGAGTVAEATAPLVRPTPSGVPEAVAAAGIPADVAPKVGETLGEVIRGARAPEGPAITPEQVREVETPAQRAAREQRVEQLGPNIPPTVQAQPTVGPRVALGQTPEGKKVAEADVHGLQQDLETVRGINKPVGEMSDQELWFARHHAIDDLERAKKPETKAAVQARLDEIAAEDKARGPRWHPESRYNYEADQEGGTVEDTLKMALDEQRGALQRIAGLEAAIAAPENRAKGTKKEQAQIEKWQKQLKQERDAYEGTYDEIASNTMGVDVEAFRQQVESGQPPQKAPAPEQPVGETRAAREGFRTGDVVRYEAGGKQLEGVITDPGGTGMRARIRQANGTYIDRWGSDLIPVNFKWQTTEATTPGPTPEAPELAQDLAEVRGEAKPAGEPKPPTPVAPRVLDYINQHQMPESVRQYLHQYAEWSNSPPGSGRAPSPPSDLTGPERIALKIYEDKIGELTTQAADEAARAPKPAEEPAWKKGDAVWYDGKPYVVQGAVGDRTLLILREGHSAANTRQVNRSEVTARETATTPTGPTAVKALAKGEKPDWTEIGKNAIGQTLYEDQRGVRSYIENGVRHSEPVGMRPTRAGVEITVDRTREEAKRQWEVAPKATPAEKNAARAESMAASAPFAYDLEDWKAEQRDMGFDDDEIDEAVRQSTALGIDPTKSDDLYDLGHFHAAVEKDADFRKEQEQLGHVGKPELIEWAKQQPEPEAEAALLASKPKPKEPVYFRSGVKNAPADFDGLADANVPIGVTADGMTPAIEERVIEYVNDGGKVFVDSGAFSQYMSGKTVDFDAILTRYERIAAAVEGSEDGLYVVAPDVVGKQYGTMLLWEKYRRRLESLTKRGVRVIFPAQQPDAARPTDNTLDEMLVLIRRSFGESAVAGIPFNKAAWSTEDVVSALKLAGDQAPDIHLLGIGERNPRYNKTIAEIQKVAPSIEITSDSNRMAAMFVSGRPAHTKVGEQVEANAPERVDVDVDADTTELTAAFWNNQPKQFTKGELQTLAEALGTTPQRLVKTMGDRPALQALVDMAGGDQRIDVAISNIALERAKATERPAARTRVITEAEGESHAERPVEGEQPTGAGDTGEPVSGAGGEGAEGVAGEQPSTGEGVRGPKEAARRGKSGKRGSRSGQGEGAELPSAGAEPGAGTGAESASHVDTADLADTQDEADANARGEAPRWITIANAGEITEGGWAAKLDANLEALKLLKQLQKEGRPASDAEQQVIGRYIGWGHTELAPIVSFEEEPNLRDPRKEQARQDLEQLLTKEELKALGESTANAHYSFHDLPNAMWDLVHRLGFSGGSILEPAVGTGHFLGTMPGPIRTHRRTVVYGVDKEPIAAGIAQQLYQGAHIQASPLEEAVLPEGYFDLVISNVPFGKIGVFDPNFVSSEKTPMTRAIHNYYFAKAIDLARPGGLIVFVTSRYTMDSRTDTHRRYIAERANLIGAFRLPEQAFRKTAGTDVVTDVIVLQKKDPTAPSRKGESWLGVVKREDLGARYEPSKGREGFVYSNEYYQRHPDHILGTEARTGKMRGQIHGYNVEGTVSPEQLAGVVAKFPEGVYSPAKAAPRKVAKPQKGEPTKEGAFVVEGGKLYTYDRGTLTPSKLSGLSLARAKAFVPLRDAYQTTIDVMLRNGSDEELKAAQTGLRRQYDAYVKKFGHVNKRENRRVIDADPNSSRIMALENVDVLRGEKGAPQQIIVTGLADIFSKRLMRPPQEATKADNAHDALVQSVAWKGMVDMPYMSGLTGKTAPELAEELEQEIYQDPVTQGWVTRDEYLSGDVVTKLAQAKAAAETQGKYAGNVTALEAVQPTPITIDDFTGDPDVARSAPFGATWVPVDLITKFIHAHGGPNTEIRLLNTKSKVEWYVDGWGRHEFMPEGADYARWMGQALNGELPKIYRKTKDGEELDPEATERYRQSLTQLREQWDSWWKGESDVADQIVSIYNAMFNREVAREFDGSRLVLPNSNPEIQLREGQKTSVVGALQRGNTLLAQAVGWGKTYEMIAIAGEWKRLGLANKPMIVVPNHLVEQWRRHFLSFYPSARVLLPERRDFEMGNRKRLIARIANNDWDAVVVGASQFLRIGVKLETLKQFITEQEEQLLAEGASELGVSTDTFSDLVDGYGEGDKLAKRAIGGRGVPRSVKDVARAILNLRKRLKKRTDQQKKDPINFEDLGVDGLVVDEAHMFKNLYFYTSKTDIVGLKGSDADQALDMYLKVRHINDRSNNRNLLFATGTPITNTMSELYTMFRYLAQTTLDRLGMAGFDSWANAYAEAVGSMEPAPEGGYRERTRLAEWSNLQELSKMFRRFADVITTEDILKENARLEAKGEAPLIKLPKVRKTTIALDPHPQFDAFMDDLKSRVEALRTGKVDPKDDNFLKVTTAAGLAAIDMRLVLPGAVDDPGGRLQTAAREIAKRYTASKDILGTQLVFLDVGVPSKKEIPPLPASISAAAAPVAEETGEEAEEETGDLVDAEAEGEAALDQIRSEGFSRNLYGELKKLLIQQGIKPDEIAFIHQAQIPSEQGRLYEAVNEGKIRVLMATRAKGGTGMNVQKRIVALHHLDVPWRPDQMEQAEGRAIRQGNLNEEVEILRYVTKKSFDEYRWYVLSKKQGFISGFMRGTIGAGEDVDPTQVDMQLASALASGDSRVMELLHAERALRGLRARYENYNRRRSRAKRDLALNEEHVERTESNLKVLRPLSKQMHDWRKNPVLKVTARPSGYGFAQGQGRDFNLSSEEDKKALRDVLKPLAEVETYREREHVGTAGPFTVHRATDEREHDVVKDNKLVKEKNSYGYFAVTVAPDGKERNVDTSSIYNPETDNIGQVVSTLNQALNADWADTQIRYAERLLKDANQEIDSAKAILDKTFEQKDVLDAKEREVRDLRLALGIEKAAQATTPATAEGEQPPPEEPPEGEGPEFHEMRVPAPIQQALTTAGQAVTGAHDEIRAALTAPTVTKAAKLSSRALRARIAEMIHKVDYAQHQLRKVRNAFEKVSVDHDFVLDVADRMEGVQGAPPLPKWLEPWEKVRDEVWDYLKKQMADLGVDRQWRQYYLTHIWETEFKGAKAKLLARLIGRRPLEGPKGFLKKRTIPTFRQGVQKFGKNPTTWNLIDQDLYRMNEAAKFILGRQVLEDNKALGTWVFQTALKKAPKDLKPVPDKIGEVWAPPEVTVSEAYDVVLNEGLENFLRTLGVQYSREVRSGNAAWGRTNAKTGEIKMRFGAPDFALMHEVGHALDTIYGLYAKIAKKLTSPQFGGKSKLRELEDLAKLRHQGMPPNKGFEKYVQTHAEQIANLVHGYLYAPELTKKVAPTAYDELDDLILSDPTLEMLSDLQQMRGLVVGQRDATMRLPGPVLLGRYYAPPEVVRILKNYLTPGLSANRLWELVRVPMNVLVQTKLAASAFHAFTVTQEAAALEAGRGITRVLRGKPSGILSFAKFFYEPIAVVAEGYRIGKEWNNTLDPLSLAADSATRLLIAGGGRNQQSREYSNNSIQKFLDNLRRANGAFIRGHLGQAGGEVTIAAIRALPALVEAAAYPILGMLVPAVKRAATVKNIRNELAHYQGVPTQQTLMAIASKAVNLSDAVLGEVIWDNYFLNRAFMSAVHMVIMAPGWRGGSAILLARGATDPIRRLFPSQREDYTFRVPAGGGPGQPPTPPGTPPPTKLVKVKERYWSMWTSAMIATVMIGYLIAELYQLMHNAGDVETPLDVAFPRTGELTPDGKPERTRLPGYAGVFYDILRNMPSSLIEYTLGGAAPGPLMIGQLYRNETTFGDEIVDHTDPWRTQLWDYAKFLEQQAEPISISSFRRRSGTLQEKAESFTGISPAPARVMRSKLEEYLHDLQPPPHRTKDQAETATARRDLAQAMRLPPAERAAAVQELMASGRLGAKSAMAVTRSQRLTYIQRAFQSTSLPQAVRGYELATPEERTLIQPWLKRKVVTLMPNVPPNDRAALLERVRAALTLPTAEPKKAVNQ